ncbi:MAG: matrixin family metalloprotease [Actinomycetota bacterium]
MTTQTASARARLFAPFLVFSLVTTLAVLAPGVPARGAVGDPAELPACRVAGPVDAGALPVRVTRSDCDLRGRAVSDHGVGAILPAAGMQVTVSAELAGGEQTLTITSNADGSVTLDDVGDDAMAGTVATAAAGTGGTPCNSCPKSCNDKALSLAGYRLPPADSFDWYFNMDTTPGNLTPSGAEGAFVSATNNIANQKNSCGMPDRVDVTTNYLGDTATEANITQSLNCQSNDGTSVVDFGPLENPAAAINCSWAMVSSGVDDLVEADIRIDDNGNWITVMSGCNNKYDLQGIATHERGHTFGLAHVTSSHGNLTMSTYGLPECSKAYRTLGRGDAKGLRQLY